MSPRSMRGIAAVSLLSGICLSVPALADYRSNFRDGVRAYRNQRLQVAARLLRLALSERPKAEAARINVPGSGRLSYTPNTLLAIVLARQQECDSAAVYARLAEDQGVARVNAPRLYEEMQAATGRCPPSAETPPPPAEPGTRELIQDAQQMARTIQSILDRPGLRELLPGAENLEQRSAHAQNTLDNAKRLFALGNRDGWQQAIDDADRTSRSARQELLALRKDLEDAVRATLGSRVSQTEDAIASAESAARTWKARSESDRSRLGTGAQRNFAARARGGESQIAQARSLLDSAKSERNLSQLLEALGLAEQAGATFLDLERQLDSSLAQVEIAEVKLVEIDLDKRTAAVPEPAAPTTSGEDQAPVEATRRLEQPAASTGGDHADAAGRTPAPGGPSGRSQMAALRKGADAYFSGDYQTALDVLNPANGGGPRVVAQLHLFRAASSLALYRLGGEEDDALLDNSREELASGLAADPTLRSTPGTSRHRSQSIPPVTFALTES